MIRSITLKSDGQVSRFDALDRVALDRPSVVTLGIGPEQVARFDRVGDDLVLVLKDGRRITIADFFVTRDDERNDVVFVDGNDVMWWGQYTSPWTGFHIAEIERGEPPAAWGFAGLPGALLGLLGGGAAIGGGGGGGVAANAPPVAVADRAEVTEAGVADGGNAGEPGQPEARGNVLANDSDPDGDPLEVTDVATGAGAGTVGAPLQGLYGTLTLNADGSYVYVLDNTLAATQALASGAVAEEVFTYTISDGQGGTATAELTITVRGTNDAPVIEGGGQSGAVTEAGGLGNGAPGTASVGGRFTVTDPDSDGAAQVWDLPGTPDTTYGRFSVDADGAWRFDLDDDAPATQALRAGESVTVSYQVRVTDAHGASALEVVTITIHGADDTAVIAGSATGSVTEAGGVNDAEPGVPEASGRLEITDPDAGDAGFRRPDSLTGTYGAFTFDPATGDWTYRLDNGDPAVQALAAGVQVTDRLLVTSLDGSATQEIVVTITGSNDVPVVTDDSGLVIEDVAVAAGLLNASGRVEITDPDAGESAFVPASLAWQGGTHGGPVLGALEVEADGTWRFAVANDDPRVQALAEGEEIVQSWTVASLDGTAASTITITIRGTNDLPVISGPSTGDVTEGGPATTGGRLQVSDIDTTDTHTWSIEGGSGDHGTLTLDQDGTWTYVLDSDRPEVRALGVGDTLTETVTVRVTDSAGGYSEQQITITITGTNDAPVIDAAASDLAATVTERPDGAADENIVEHEETGFIHFSDVDASDLFHTATVAPVVDDGSYLGDFTLLPVDNAGGRVEWRFTVNDAVLDGLAEGQTLRQSYTVTITDPHGASATETVTVTIVGRNDSPEPQDDASLIVADGVAVRDVLANDTDVDTGDTGRWTVTHVDGQPIAAGGTITLSGGRGTVGLSGAGELTFTPGAGVTGQIVLPYVVNDGSGAANAAASADWIVNIVAVSITDDASPADPAVGDGVLASIDDLQNVAISGQAPVGGTITGLTVSDGTTTVTVPPGAISVGPDGAFTVTADLSGLADGPLTVTMTVEDATGATATTGASIFKDTATTVTIDPLVVVSGQIPTITGTGEPGATVTISIDGGSPVTVTVGDDGTWSHTPATPPGSDEVTIAVSAEDRYGNTAGTDRSVAGLTLTDEEPGGPEHLAVHEAGLPGGSTPSAGTDRVDTSFAIGTGEGISHVVIGGSVGAGGVTGGTTVTLAQLLDLGATPIPGIATEYGTLTITGYDPATGVVGYSYALNGNTTGHSNPGGVDSDNDILRETIQIAVIDADGDTRVDSLVAAVVDDIPVIGQGSADPRLAADEADLSVNPSASFAGLFTVSHGADGAADANATVHTLEIPSAGTDSGLKDTATGDSILLYLEGGAVVGRVGDVDGAIAFTVSTTADGTVTLDQQRAVEHPGTGTDSITIADGAILLRVTAVDADGDSVTQAITIGGRFGFKDDIPTASNDSATVGEGSYDPVTGNVLTGAGADDAADRPGADGGRVTGVSFGATTVAVPASGTVEIDGTYGTLTIEADGSYSYQRAPGTAGGDSDVFTYTLTDGDGDSATATLTIGIEDAGVGLSDLTAAIDGGDATVDERHLANGTASDPALRTVSGSFTVSAPDGIAVLSLTHDGTDYDIVLNNVAQTLPVITTALGNTLEITGYNEITGEVSYTYTLNDAETHGGHTEDALRNDLFEDFTVSLEDMDGDTTTGTLSIRIVDDIPVIETVALAIDDLKLAADDAVLSTDVSDDFAGLFSIKLGADGGSVAWTLELASDGVDSGLKDTATGGSILLYLEGGAVVGRVGGETGAIAFTVSTSATGEVTLNQQRPLLHRVVDGDGAEEAVDVVSIAPGAIALRVTATDNDGDTASEAVDIGARLTFLDDVPTAEDDEATVAAGSHDPVTGNVLGGTGAGADDAADRPGADGGRVTAVSVGTTTVPVPASGTVEIDGTYGTLTIEADGSYSYQRALGTPGDVSDTFTYTLTDGDGTAPPRR